jgi:hypothetical protein
MSHGRSPSFPLSNLATIAAGLLVMTFGSSAQAAAKVPPGSCTVSQYCSGGFIHVRTQCMGGRWSVKKTDKRCYRRKSF